MEECFIGMARWSIYHVHDVSRKILWHFTFACKYIVFSTIIQWLETMPATEELHHPFISIYIQYFQLNCCLAKESEKKRSLPIP